MKTLTTKQLTELVTSQASIIATMQAQILELQTQPAKVAKQPGIRNYGPVSQRKMTNTDAWRILHGDLQGKKARYISDHLGLSRGQVYSALGGYTFKSIKDTNETLAGLADEAVRAEQFVGPIQ